MARLVALFKSFHLRLHPAIRGAIITIDIGESCAWPYTGIMDLHSISFCPQCQFSRPIFVKYFPLTTAHPSGRAVFLYKKSKEGHPLLHLEPVTPDNWRSGLSVRGDQREYVADSPGLLARAYAYRNSRSEAFVIDRDDTPAGMTLTLREVNQPAFVIT